MKKLFFKISENFFFKSSKVSLYWICHRNMALLIRYRGCYFLLEKFKILFCIFRVNFNFRKSSFWGPSVPRFFLTLLQLDSNLILELLKSIKKTLFGIFTYSAFYEWESQIRFLSFGPKNGQNHVFSKIGVKFSS